MPEAAGWVLCYFAAGCPYGSVDLWPGRELTGQTSARPNRLADALVRFGHSGVQSAVVFCSNANGKLSIVLESDVQNQGAAELFGNLWPLGVQSLPGVDDVPRCVGLGFR